jgi:hypothetical protein
MYPYDGSGYTRRPFHVGKNTSATNQSIYPTVRTARPDPFPDARQADAEHRYETLT